MQVSAVLLPYLLGAVSLLLLATLRAWRVFDAKVDLLLAACLCVIAAAVTGAVDLGTDAPAYRDYYSTLLETKSLLAWWEPGFAYLAWLFAWAGAPYGLFAFVCALTSHLIKLHVFNEVAPNRLLAFFILFCLGIGELAFVRQHLAASLVLLAFLLMSRRKVVTSLAVILLASLFHKSALIAGVVVLVMSYGLRSIKPLAMMTAALGAVMLVVPEIRNELIGRVEAQVASYAVEEFVQGVGTGEVSLIRNVAKLFAYAAFAGWMLLLPARSATEQIQSQAAKIVIGLSLLSAILIFAVSPVFARIANYLFPFLALSVRAERFAPYPSQFAGQYASTLLLVLYLLAAMIPLAEYF